MPRPPPRASPRRTLMQKLGVGQRSERILESERAFVAGIDQIKAVRSPRRTGHPARIHVPAGAPPAPSGGTSRACWSRSRGERRRPPLYELRRGSAAAGRVRLDRRGSSRRSSQSASVDQALDRVALGVGEQQPRALVGDRRQHAGGQLAGPATRGPGRARADAASASARPPPRGPRAIRSCRIAGAPSGGISTSRHVTGSACDRLEVAAQARAALARVAVAERRSAGRRELRRARARASRSTSASSSPPRSSKCP